MINNRVDPPGTTQTELVQRDLYLHGWSCIVDGIRIHPKDVVVMHDEERVAAKALKVIEDSPDDFPDRQAMSRRIAFQRKQLRRMETERDAAVKAMNEAFDKMRESQKEAAALRRTDFIRLRTLEHMGALVERLEAAEAALLGRKTVREDALKRLVDAADMTLKAITRLHDGDADWPHVSAFCQTYGDDDKAPLRAALAAIQYIRETDAVKRTGKRDNEEAEPLAQHLDFSNGNWCGDALDALIKSQR